MPGWRPTLRASVVHGYQKVPRQQRAQITQVAHVSPCQLSLCCVATGTHTSAVLLVLYKYEYITALCIGYDVYPIL